LVQELETELQIKFQDLGHIRINHRYFIHLKLQVLGLEINLIVHLRKNRSNFQVLGNIPLKIRNILMDIHLELAEKKIKLIRLLVQELIRLLLQIF